MVKHYSILTFVITATDKTKTIVVNLKSSAFWREMYLYTVSYQTPKVPMLNLTPISVKYCKYIDNKPTKMLIYVRI